jgi:hypothetical protein
LIVWTGGYISCLDATPYDSAAARDQGETMYIGVGTLVFILLIVLIVMALRRA